MGRNFTTFFIVTLSARFGNSNLSPKPIECNWWNSTQNRTKVQLKSNFRKVLTLMCVQCNFIQNNSTLFWRFTLYSFCIWTIFIFIHTKKEKSLSTERLLICPRDETGSLYITRVFKTTTKRGFETVRCFALRLNCDHTHSLYDTVFETSEHDDVFFPSHS